MNNMGMEHNNRVALNNIRLSQQMQITRDRCEQGAMLLAVASLMMRRGISMKEALSMEHYDERIKLMMSEGVDESDAHGLCMLDLHTLIDAE